MPHKANPRKEEKHMSKMKDMAMTIEELRSAAAAINDVADWLTQQFSGNADEPKEQPKKKPELKLEDVRAVLADMSRKGQSSRRRGHPLRPSAEPYVRRYRIRLFAKLYGILYPVNIHLDLWPSHRVLLKHHVELFKVHTRTLTSPIEPFE